MTIVVSHFAVAADLIRKGIVTPAAYHNWAGRILVLSAEHDPTQSKKDIPRYERLFGRAVAVVGMGDMGHTAALFNPDKYVSLLEQALMLPGDWLLRGGSHEKCPFSRTCSDRAECWLLAIHGANERANESSMGVEAYCGIPAETGRQSPTVDLGI